MIESSEMEDLITEAQDTWEREGLAGLLRLADEHPEDCFVAMAVLLPGRFLKALAVASSRRDPGEG